jgi:hypothetical protein
MITWKLTCADGGCVDFGGEEGDSSAVESGG